MSTRMFSYRQVLTTKDQILTMPATDNIKKQMSCFFKLSPANFVNVSLDLQNSFVAEAIEYAVNPFQMGNNDDLVSNVFEVSLYNFNKTVI
jgi:hypothetical protein